jgi:DNA polymerase (family X)
MAQAAVELGYEYICISDHVGTLRIANGLDEKRLTSQRKEIDSVHKKMGRAITVMQGSEVNILSDGKLDMPDRVLKGLDVVVASVHGGFRQTREQMTARIVSAMENENVDIIGHPTGREIQRRQAYELDMEKVFETSKSTGTFLEVDAYPDRLDLNADNVRAAIGKGCMIVIDTDAHSAAQLRYMRLGIATARRGWAKNGDVVNTLPLSKFMRLLDQ